MIVANLINLNQATIEELIRFISLLLARLEMSICIWRGGPRLVADARTEGLISSSLI